MKKRKKTWEIGVSPAGWTIRAGIVLESNLPSSFLSSLLLALIKAKPSLPEVSGPSNRASPGQGVTLTCKSTGFFPKNIYLKWFENGVELPALQTDIFPPGDAFSYTIVSTTLVTLAFSSLHSQVTCQVAHSELQSPLSSHVNISKFLQGKDRSNPAAYIVFICYFLLVSFNLEQFLRLSFVTPTFWKRTGQLFCGP